MCVCVCVEQRCIKTDTYHENHAEEVTAVEIRECLTDWEVAVVVFII